MPDKLTLINYDIHAGSYCISDKVIQVTECAMEQVMTILEIQNLIDISLVLKNVGKITFIGCAFFKAEDSVIRKDVLH